MFDEDSGFSLWLQLIGSICGLLTIVLSTCVGSKINDADLERFIVELKVGENKENYSYEFFEPLVKSLNDDTEKIKIKELSFDVSKGKNKNDYILTGEKYKLFLSIVDFETKFEYPKGNIQKKSTKVIKIVKRI